jgi:phosphoglycolate phosphatase-like HAD superfamily hydrolase
MDVEGYQTLVFDCDGVVLDSNKVKTQAFYNAALPYGKRAASALVDFHVANGGISRYLKFDMFLKDIAPDKTVGPNLEELLSAYAIEVRKGLFSCEVARGLRSLRQNTQHANWLIVSGGDQEELRDVFDQRELLSLFDGGIFGSPENKDQILTREKANGNIQHPAVFLGDSKYDMESSKRSGLDFVFVSDWSEWEDSSAHEENFNGKVSCLGDI